MNTSHNFMLNVKVKGTNNSHGFKESLGNILLGVRGGCLYSFAF